MNLNNNYVKDIIGLVKSEIAEENRIGKHFVKVDYPQELLERCIKKTTEFTLKKYKSLFFKNPK